MKFFILFVLVSLGLCVDLPVPVPLPAADCTTGTLKDVVGLPKVVLSLTCALTGPASVDEQNAAINAYNTQLGSLSTKTECITQKLAGLTVKPLVDKSGEGAQKIIEGLGRTTKQLGIADNIVTDACNLINSLLNPACLSKITNTVSDKAVQTALKLDLCQLKKDNLDLNALTSVLDKSGCLDVLPKNLKALETVQPVISLVQPLASNLAATVDGILNPLFCAVDAALNGAKGLLANLPAVGKGATDGNKGGVSASGSAQVPALGGGAFNLLV
ncbi:uncharacterized protein [Hyperolius riggenbachi]|uniref:uncharacterized protein n=1 Tax=Hyperolius riggenbachi TaxID=752182 RepID=UPI0035A2E95F